MDCPVTGWIFAQPGKHRKCPTCPHCLLCDHYTEPETHAHWRDSQQMKGLDSRMFKTTVKHFATWQCAIVKENAKQIP